MKKTAKSKKTRQKWHRAPAKADSTSFKDNSHKEHYVTVDDGDLAMHHIGNIHIVESRPRKNYTPQQVVEEFAKSPTQRVLDIVLDSNGITTADIAHEIYSVTPFIPPKAVRHAAASILSRLKRQGRITATGRGSKTEPYTWSKPTNTKQ